MALAWRQNVDMRVRPKLAVSLGVAVVVAAAAACTTDYQQGKGDPNFGGPNALAGQRPPGATVDVETEGGVPANVPGSKPKCVAAGGSLADAGACSVSLSKDVLAAFGTAGCADPGSCHGGTTPRNEPRIEPSDGPSMWQEFQAFTLSTGKPYINPCSTNDSDSQMACNLLNAGAPGACGVHMPVTGPFPTDAHDKIVTWLKCGAPNN
jgi:hypothetical protein